MSGEIKSIYQNMRNSFPIVQSFSAPMTIYPGVFWTFGFSSKRFSATNINSDKRLEMSKIEQSLKWYNTDWHTGAFSLSNFHKQKIGQL